MAALWPRPSAFARERGRATVTCVTDLFGNPDPVEASAASRAGGSLSGAGHGDVPLAVRMRPRTVDEIVGQQHLLGPGSPLRRLAAGQPM